MKHPLLSRSEIPTGYAEHHLKKAKYTMPVPATGKRFFLALFCVPQQTAWSNRRQPMTAPHKASHSSCMIKTNASAGEL